MINESCAVNATVVPPICSDKGNFLPILNETTWPLPNRIIIYFLGLIYSILGMATIADIFMCSIEKITSKTRLVTVKRGVGVEQVVEVPIWNVTVANLTLVALGSSAPEILITIIEMLGNSFTPGDLGPSAIVGSAAFNLFVITAVCIVSVPSGEVKRIQHDKVFYVTGFFSIFAYLWLFLVLVIISPKNIELWEAFTTLGFFPVLVLLAYTIDKCRTLCGITTDDDKSLVWNRVLGVDRNFMSSFMGKIKKFTGISDKDAAKLAAVVVVEKQPHSVLWYRIQALRKMKGGRKVEPKIKSELQEVYDALKTEEDSLDHLSPDIVKKNDHAQAVIEFAAASCAVMERDGRVKIAVNRRGMKKEKVSVKYETVDGTAENEKDYIAKKDRLTFEPYEVTKYIDIAIVVDNQWEPDETFFVKLSLDDESSVKLGKKSTIEVTIIDSSEPGIIEFEKQGMLVKESCGKANISVIRRNGADGRVTIIWRATDKTAFNGKDYDADHGSLVFMHGELKKIIEIPIIDDKSIAKDVKFEVHLATPLGGAKLGRKKKHIVTITNDDDYHYIIRQIVAMTNVNLNSMRIEGETWAERFKEAMNVNGGDVENANSIDYIMHFLTFGWKVIFSFIPPASIWGGWLTFIISLIMIGLMTSLVIDMASIFGCLIGLKDTITAITFVSIGASLADLFASRQACIQEQYADNAIACLTANNSISVFLGLGLPWVMSALYWKIQYGQDFHIGGLGLTFNVMIYGVSAFLCIVIMIIRRYSYHFGQAELGGPKNTKILTAGIIFLFWIVFVILNVLKTYNILSLPVLNELF